MKANISRDEILNGNIFKGIIKLCLPLMLLNLINTLYGIVDTFFVGRIGELQVGAVSLVSPITNCGIAFSTGLSVAGIAMISRALGKDDYEKGRNIATHLLVLAVTLGLVISIVCELFATSILKWLNTPNDIFVDTRNYFIGISLDYIPLFILTIFQAIRQSCGDTKSGARLNIIASAINALLDPLFIFVFKLGTLGAALATVLSKCIMCPFALKSIFDETNPIYISLKENRIEFNIMKKIVSVAIPASLGQLLSSFGFVLMSREIVSYGSIVMSGYGIGSNISNVFYIPVNSVGSALPTFIGQNLGAKNTERARKCFSTAIKIVVVIALTVILLGFLTSRFIASLFVVNASERLIKLSLEYAYFSEATAFFMGWFNCLCGVFDGSTNTKISMILSTARLLVLRMPIVYLLARFTNLQYTGIWISMILSNFLVCIIGQVIYFKYPWTEKYINI